MTQVPLPCIMCQTHQQLTLEQCLQGIVNGFFIYIALTESPGTLASWIKLPLAGDSPQSTKAINNLKLHYQAAVPNRLLLID